jgi:hypothetical protein
MIPAKKPEEKKPEGPRAERTETKDEGRSRRAKPGGDRPRRLRGTRRRAAAARRQLRRLQAVKGKLVPPAAAARVGRATKSPSALVYFDLEEREEKTVLDDATASRSTPTARSCSSPATTFAIVEIKPEQKFEKPMPTADIETRVDPARRVAADVRRRLPLPARLLLRPEHARRGLGRRPRALRRLLDDAVTRWDVNFVSASSSAS